MSDSPKVEVTQAYLNDVKARFEKLEAKIKELEDFARQLGHSPKN